MRTSRPMAGKPGNVGRTWLTATLATVCAACGSAGLAGRVPTGGDYPVATHAISEPTIAQRVAKALGELSAGRLDAAEYEARAALREAPEHPGASVALARILAKGSDASGALRLLRHAWREADAGASGRRVGVDAAQAESERVALAPELARALRAAFESAMADRAVAEADALYREWLQLKADGPDPDMAARLGDALILAGATESGCRTVAAAQDPSSFSKAWCRIVGAQSLAELAGSDKLDTFAPAADGRATGWLRVGRVLLAHGRSLQAHEAFDRAARADGDDPRTLAAGAVPALVAGDHALALERVGKAVRRADDGDDKRRILTEALALATELNRVETAYALGAMALDGDLAGVLPPADVVAILSRPLFAAHGPAARTALLVGHVRDSQIVEVAQVLEQLQRTSELEAWHQQLDQDGRDEGARLLLPTVVRALVAGGSMGHLQPLAAKVAPPANAAEAIATAATLKAIGVEADWAKWPEAARRWVQATTSAARLRLAEEAPTVSERLAMARALERTDERSFSAGIARSAFGLVDGKSRDRGRRELLEIHLFLLGHLAREGSTAGDDTIAHHAAALAALAAEGAWQPGSLATAVLIERLSGTGRITRSPHAAPAFAALDVPGRSDAASHLARALVAAGIAADPHLRRLAERLTGGAEDVDTVLQEVSERMGVGAWLPHRAGVGAPPFDAHTQLERIARGGGDVCPLTRYLHPAAAGSLERMLALGALPPCQPGRDAVLVAALADEARAPGNRPPTKLQEAANFALQRGFHDAAVAIAEARPNPSDSLRQLAMRAHVRAGRIDAALALAPASNAAPSRSRRPGVFETMRVLAEEGAPSAALTLGQGAGEGDVAPDSAVVSESFEQLRRMENPDGARALAAKLTAGERTIDAGFAELLSRHLAQVGLSDVAVELVERLRTQRRQDSQLLRVAYRLALQRRDAKVATETGSLLINEIRGNPSQLQSFVADARLAAIPGLAVSLAEGMAKRFPTAPEAAVVRTQAALEAGDIEGAVRAAGLGLGADGAARTTLGALESVFSDARYPAAFARALAPVVAEGRPRADVSLALARALLADGATDEAAGVLGGLVLDVDAALPLVADLWRSAGFHDAALADAVRALQVGPDAEAFAFFTRSIDSLVATGRGALFPELVQTLAVVQPDLGHDQRAELADLAALAGRPADAEALRRSTATPEARIRAMTALSRQCIARNDAPCALEAWRHFVEARLAAPQLAGRGDGALVVALFEALLGLADAPTPFAELAPSLVAAFDHRFSGPGPRATLRALAAVIAGEAPTHALNRNMFPARDGLNRLPQEQVAVHYVLIERALASGEYATAMAIGRWLLAQTADRHAQLTVVKAAIRAGYPDVAWMLADDLVAASPVANAGVLVEQLALEGVTGLAQQLAEAHLQAGGPSPIAQRAVGTLAAVVDGGAGPLTPGDTRENRLEQRLFDIAAAFDDGDPGRVVALFEPLVGHANIEARIVELATRAYTVARSAEDFGRFIERMGMVPNLFGTAMVPLLAATQRALAPQHVLAMLERLHAASPGDVRWVTLGVAAAISLGDATTLGKWAGPDRAGRMEAGARAEIAVMLARAGHLDAARGLATNLAPTTWPGWRAVVHIAAGGGDLAALEALVREAGRFASLAESASVAEVLRAVENAPDPSVLQAAVTLLDARESKGVFGSQAMIDDALRVAARGGDVARVQRWLAHRVNAFPGEPLPADVTTWLVCRAATSTDSRWTEAATRAWQLVATLQQTARLAHLEAFGTGRLVVTDGGCSVVPLPAKASTSHPKLQSLSELALRALGTSPDSWNTNDLMTRLHLQQFHGQHDAAVDAARQLAAIPGPSGQGLIELAEALVATNPAEAARIARSMRARPTPGRITDHVGLPEFPVQRARALVVLAVTHEDADDAARLLETARIAWPESASWRRAAHVARSAAGSDDGRALGALFSCHRIAADAPVCRFAKAR